MLWEGESARNSVYHEKTFECKLDRCFWGFFVIMITLCWVYYYQGSSIFSPQLRSVWHDEGIAIHISNDDLCYLAQCGIPLLERAFSNMHFAFVSCSSFHCYNSDWLFLFLHFSWSQELINAYIKSKLEKNKHPWQKALWNPETTFREFIRLHVVLHDYAA